MFRAAAGAALAMTVTLGCAAQQPPLAPALRAAIYDDAARTFSRATLWSPEDGDELAPLFVVERAAAGEGDSSRTLKLRLETGQFEHRGLALTWRDYRWSFSDGRGGALRGVFGEDGFPLLYEVLTDSREIRRVFVSTTLETEAAAEHGAILDGCRYAIERAADDSGRTIVAAEFENGAMPLGPFVYLDAAHGDVTTVICRCMPTQVETIDSAKSYELEEAEATSGFSFERYAASLRLPAFFSPRPDRR